MPNDGESGMGRQWEGQKDEGASLQSYLLQSIIWFGRRQTARAMFGGSSAVRFR